MWEKEVHIYGIPKVHNNFTWSNVLDFIIIFRQIWCVRKWLEGVNIGFYTKSLLNLISKYYLFLCRRNIIFLALSFFLTVSFLTSSLFPLLFLSSHTLLSQWQSQEFIFGRAIYKKICVCMKSKIVMYNTS